MRTPHVSTQYTAARLRLRRPARSFLSKLRRDLEDALRQVTQSALRARGQEAAEFEVLGEYPECAALYGAASGVMEVTTRGRV